MTRGKNSLHAVVVLPAGSAGRIVDPAQRRWLARSRLELIDTRSELLLRVLTALNVDAPEGSLAALRLWGQTGERPTVWIAAADPVYLEPRLDHVCLHALSEAELPLADLRSVFDLLQATLGSNGANANGANGADGADGANGANGSHAFALVGALGYLRARQPIETADVSPLVADGASPDIFLPEGEKSQTHDRLQSEVQMCLYESEVNARREEAGVRPINSLWFWGGGAAPPEVARDLPALYADEPLLKGYWHSSGAPVKSWPGNIDACLDLSAGGFVAVVPDAQTTANNDALTGHLSALRRLLAAGKLRRLTLIFRDGITAEVRRGDRFRLWRRHSPVLEERGSP